MELSWEREVFKAGDFLCPMICKSCNDISNRIGRFQGGFYDRRLRLLDIKNICARVGLNTHF